MGSVGQNKTDSQDVNITVTVAYTDNPLIFPEQGQSVMCKKFIKMLTTREIKSNEQEMKEKVALAKPNQLKP